MQISLIDSGIGGKVFGNNLLFDVNDLEIEYLVDYKNFPYGNKDLSFLKERLIELVNKANNQIVVIACNTLSSIIFHYNLSFNKTVVDVITPTIFYLKDKNYSLITVYATKNTIFMNIFEKLLNTKIIYIDATKLISAIENDYNIEEEFYKLVNKTPKYSECIVLGCTHLIKIKELFRNTFNREIISQDELFVKLFKE